MKLAKFAIAILLATAASPQASAVVFMRGPFVVFFDLDSAELRSEDKDIMKYAARAYIDNEIVLDDMIVLAGYADRSGTKAHNRNLARRRTETVRTFLIENGIRSDRITSQPYGEDPGRLRVVTPDGKPHKENRRVEVYFENRNRVSQP